VYIDLHLKIPWRRGEGGREGGEEHIPICNADSPFFRALCLISYLPSCLFSLRMNEESSSPFFSLGLGQRWVE
jgi:hypothetical protein